MPIVLTRQFPLPSLQTYVAFCLAVLSSCLFYAFYKCKDISQAAILPTDADSISNSTELTDDISAETSEGKYSAESLLVCNVLSSDGWAVFLVINFAYCVMFLAGKLIQHVVFGTLRAVERQHLRERFWNFVFYKFVFLFGILNVQAMFTFICWLGWFTILGLTHIGLQLCFDRFEFVANNPTTPRRVYAKLIGLVTTIFFVAVSLICASFWAFCADLAGLNLLAFMLAEGFMLFIRIAYVITRVFIHFKDTSPNSARWEDKDIIVYYVNLYADLLLYAVDLANHIHMLLWGNAFLSVTSLIIFLQIRQLYNEVTHRLKRHWAWSQVVQSIDRCLTSVSAIGIDPSEQTCSICWESMSSAKRLPCKHLFHATCLRSWLDYDMTCPVCRRPLHKFLMPGSSHTTGSSQTMGGGSGNTNESNSNNQEGQATNTAVSDHESRIVRRRFTINASRYISWIPNLSIELRTPARTVSPTAAAQIHGMQLDAMAQQVRAVLPQVPMPVILGDLQITGSVEQVF